MSNEDSLCEAIEANLREIHASVDAMSESQATDRLTAILDALADAVEAAPPGREFDNTADEIAEAGLLAAKLGFGPPVVSKVEGKPGKSMRQILTIAPPSAGVPLTIIGKTKPSDRAMAIRELRRWAARLRMMPAKITGRDRVLSRIRELRDSAIRLRATPVKAHGSDRIDSREISKAFIAQLVTGKGKARGRAATAEVEVWGWKASAGKVKLGTVDMRSVPEKHHGKLKRD